MKDQFVLFQKKPVNWFQKNKPELIKFLENFHSNFQVTPSLGWMIQNYISDSPLLTDPECPECKTAIQFKLGNTFSKFCSHSCSSKNIRREEKETKKDKTRIPIPPRIALLRDLVDENVDVLKKYNISKDTLLVWKRKLDISSKNRLKPIKQTSNIKQENLSNCVACGKEYIKNRIDQMYCCYSCSNTSISRNEITKEKKKQTNLQRYGVEYPSQSQTVKNKFKTTMSKYKYHPNEKPSYYEKIISYHKKGKSPTEIQFILKNEVSYTFIRNIILRFTDLEYIERDKAGTSSLEKMLVNEFYNVDGLERNRRLLENKQEIDLLFSKQKIGVEINGWYYHSNDTKEKNYHLIKTNNAKKIGIDLLHFWESEIIEKFDLVTSIIKNRLNLLEKRIYARKCEIKIITSKEAKVFCDENHIQGFSGAKIHLALTYNNEIISYMSFGVPRYNRKYEWELVRFCNKKNHSVIGSASKLLSHFEKTIIPKSIISYQDIRLFNGNLYSKLGFLSLKTNPPNYFYRKNNRTYRRELFQKKFLEKKLHFYDHNLSEHENMKLNGYKIYYDCGTNVWSKFRK